MSVRIWDRWFVWVSACCADGHACGINGFYTVRLNVLMALKMKLTKSEGKLMKLLYFGSGFVNKQCLIPLINGRKINLN